MRAPFEPCDEHLSIALPGARAVFTSRHGGFSTGPYATFNLGRLTDDAPEAVHRNRTLLQQRAGGRLAMIRQVHGARVVRIDERPSGPSDPVGPDSFRELEEADGHATALQDVAPMVLVADCLPVVVAGGGALAVLHAGWRGLADGVLAEGMRAVRELGSGGPMEAAIGPGAGVCCYEVGEEVHRRFASPDRDRFRRGDNLDLKAIAREQLERAGVDAVHDAGLCTICDRDFFSHRRDRGLTGRQSGVAWLT
jgi:purine-nucleoside/S-methyl-5'-thioadenosine phosphorylase / adenosine deaminase